MNNGSGWESQIPKTAPEQVRLRRIQLGIYETTWIKIEAEAVKYMAAPGAYLSGMIRGWFGEFGITRVVCDLQIPAADVQTVQERLGSRPLGALVTALLRAWCGLPEAREEIKAAVLKSSHTQKNIRMSEEDAAVWEAVAAYKDVSVSEAVRLVMLAEYGRLGLTAGRQE